MSVGFGLERLGLLALRFTRLSLTFVAILTIILFAASTFIEFRSDLREVFKTRTPDFQTFQEMTRQYPGSELDVMILAEASDLITPQRLEKLRDLHIELRFLEEVQSVTSLFSARQRPDSEGNANPLLPDDLSEVANWAELKQELFAHPIIKNRLISADGRMALLVIGLRKIPGEVAELGETLNRMRTIASGLLRDSEIKVSFSGIPAMRVTIVETLIRDQKIFQVTGVVLGFLIAWLVFRRWDHILLIVMPVLIAVTWLIGGMWVLGQNINILTTIVPTLVMVIAYCDSLHLMFAIRRKMRRGTLAAKAVEEAVLEVGPACVLTSLTTAIALSTLAIFANEFVGHFGLTAAAGTIIAYIAIMCSFPPAAALVLAKTGRNDAKIQSETRVGALIDAISSKLIELVLSRPKTIAFSGVSLLVICGIFYAQNEPRYRYAEHLPRKSEPAIGHEKIDRNLSGVNTARIFLQWSKPQDLLSPQVVNVVRKADAILANAAGITATFSVASIADWIAWENQTANEHLRNFEEQLDSRLISTKDNSAIVVGYHREMESADVVMRTNSIRSRLNELERENPGLKASMSGITPLAASMSGSMIKQLNYSLLFAIIIIIVLMGLALRSWSAAMMSIVPNLFPLTIAGTFLYAAGNGLQFTSVIAFTVGFGIAVDSTIHVFIRHKLSQEKHPADDAALRETFQAIGPVVIFTAMVLMSGLGAIMLSSMPMVQLYGQVTCLVVFAAIFGDLLFLPAIMRLVPRKAKTDP